MSAEYWIEGFRTRFLRVVDEVAANRIRQAALAAGKLTAISPRGTIDAIVTGSLALELIGDLCTIYNLKANRFETLRILGLVFASAGIANEADEWSQSTAESMFDSLSTEWLPGILGAVGARVAGAPAARSPQWSSCVGWSATGANASISGLADFATAAMATSSLPSRYGSGVSRLSILRVSPSRLSFAASFPNRPNTDSAASRASAVFPRAGESPGDSKSESNTAPMPLNRISSALQPQVEGSG